jgi:hypothetical protein
LKLQFLLRQAGLGLNVPMYSTTKDAKLHEGKFLS